MTVENYTDDLALLTNTPALAESLLHSLEQAAGSISIYMNANKTEFMFSTRRSQIHFRWHVSKISKQFHMPR